ncbi:helix-turn-helix transcriptional regulator [Shinella zoogloeoides]|uniref:helix-turn-helix transcriptional regulator n=1 Tax=Shinella zoogloeoides TaxID=352475 RepID=UPI00273FD1AA|nr:PAS domain-containing protein [Shinella zoogloeoides]WLR94627.1 PAS domain-containing protein [Shinella zoogloeoides]
MFDSSNADLLLRQHATTAAAVSTLFYPHAEVVLHDLETGLIAGIWNAFSGRKAGTESLVENELEEAGEAGVYGPYEKTGEDGRRLKSVTAVLKDEFGQAIGLFCINMDVSHFDAAAKLLAAFAGAPALRPPSLFAGDWREAINTALHDWLRGRGLALTALRKADRVALVGALDERGLFQTRNAVDHLAGLIGASRASIYNYLADARRQSQKDRTP